MEARLPFRIAEPCAEDWQDMEPDGPGRHCAQCCKTVVDFSDWNTEEILSYLRSSEGRGSCGRFKKSQLEIPRLPEEQFVNNIWQSNLKTAYKIAATILLFFSVGFSSCITGRSNDDGHSTVQNDRITAPAGADHSDMMLGKPIEMDTAMMKKKYPLKAIRHKKKPMTATIAEPIPMRPDEYTMGIPPFLPEPPAPPIPPDTTQMR